MEERDIRFGIIGMGVIGRSHARRLTSAASPARLVAVADVNPVVAESAGAEYGVEHASDAESLLSRPDIDAVVIATPSGIHREPAIAALEAGKHVLLEKPIEVTVEAADRIIEAEQRSGKLLTIASPRRFATQNLLIRELLDTGHFGRITSMAVESPFWRTQEYYDSAGWRGTWALDGGGALMNQGVHLVDLALWFLGDVEEVYAHAGLLAHERIEVEDTVTVTARMGSGALMTFQATTAAYGDLPVRLNLMGDRASITTEGDGIVRHASAEGVQLPNLTQRDLNEQAMAQLDDFVHAIRIGCQPLVTAQQARSVVAFVEAVYESARAGRPVVPAKGC